MLKNKSNFIEYNIIIPFFIKKWYRKWEKTKKIVHLIIETEKIFTNVHFELYLTKAKKVNIMQNNSLPITKIVI